jgi:hypothetical protein
VGGEIDFVHLGVCDLDAGGIGCVIDLGFDVEAGSGCGGRNQLDDGLVADQWFATPVLCDE